MPTDDQINLLSRLRELIVLAEKAGHTDTLAFDLDKTLEFYEAKWGIPAWR